MSDDTAQVRFRSGELAISLSGPVAFVQTATQYFKPILEEFSGVLLEPGVAVAVAEPEAPEMDLGSVLDDPADPVVEEEELDTDTRAGRFLKWYRNLTITEGRTHKRDLVLAFIYYATVVEGQGWASPGTIRWAFEQVEEEGPKALTQMIINIRKHENWIAKPEEGTRGQHRLTKYGKRYVEKFVS